MSDTLRRAVGILDALARADVDLSIREIGARAQVPKSAVQRLLGSLVETGLAVQDPVTRRYGLGPRTLSLGTAYQRRIDLRSVALPHMVALRDRTEETVGLSVLVGEELMHVAQVESASELRRSFDTGRTLPLWAGAPARVFLAELPDAEVAGVVRRHQPSSIVPVSPPTLEQLLTSVRETRSTGLATAYQETIAGVNTIAAAVRGADGQVLAALSVTGPTSRLDSPTLSRCGPALLATARAVSKELGYQD